MSGDQIIGKEFGLKSVMDMVKHVAEHDSPVLLLGETGVGKDIVANAIHYSSSRSSGPFIVVNCGAIPGTLLDSELFGHEKGAFTGALAQKRGRFERAHQGTIFLDEIGELTPEAQVRLLRVLQNHEIERVGGSKTIQVDIRIIAATNRNLEQMVACKQFREDLWFRLNVFPIMIPPLRARRTDIPALVNHFLEKKTLSLKLRQIPELAVGSMNQLLDYHWPGNVRELENVVERALILNKTGPVDFDILGKKGQVGPVLEASQAEGKLPPYHQYSTDYLKNALAISGGKINGPEGAALLTGLNPSTLRNKLKKRGIPFGYKKTIPSTLIRSNE
jgi:formate hydrogenlyase transcriptional activator